MEKENSIGAPVEKKRKRSANWDSLEKNLLRSCINEFVAIIENKNTYTNTNKAKNAAWQKITERFNELNHGSRTIVEIKQQWRTTKLDAKKKWSNYKKARNATGGGPQLPSPDPEATVIIEMIPKEFEVDFNQFDSDGMTLEDIKPNSETSTDTGISTADCSNDVVQEIIKSPVHNKENTEKIFVTPSPSRDQRNKSSQGKYSKRKLPLDVNKFAEQRNQLLTNCVEEEHKLKIIQMRESHEWAKEEHLQRMKEAEMRLKAAQIRIKNLEMESELLKVKLNNKSEE